jgi:hypothetical protein
MKIFEVDLDETPQRFYATKTEASIAARKSAADLGRPVAVHAVEIMPGKDGIVALANCDGWAVNRDLVYTAGRPRTKAAIIAEAEVDAWIESLPDAADVRHRLLPRDEADGLM